MCAGLPREVIETMNREEAIRRLKESEASLRAKGVTTLALFGSMARDTQVGGTSDVDVLVDVADSRHFSLLDLADLRLYLSDLLHCEADVVIRKNASPALLVEAATEEVRVF